MLSGSMVALITPMTERGDIDFSALSRLIEWHIASNTDALVVAGSTGEAATLSFKEREELLTHVVREVDGRIPVIAGTGTNCTKQSLDLTRQAALLGADYALVVTPYYNKPTQNGLLAHFETVAEANIPILLYNVPGRTACDCLPETVLQLAKIDNIVGIKESSTLDRCMTLLETAPDDFMIISGDDINALETVKAGGAGVISVAANVVPSQLHALMAETQRGNLEEAIALQSRLKPLFEGLFCETNPIPVKWAVHQLGLCSAGIRLPLQPLAVQYQPQLKAILDKVMAFETKIGGQVA